MENESRRSGRDAKRIYLQSNIFKVQRCVCAAYDTVPLSVLFKNTT